MSTGLSIGLPGVGGSVDRINSRILVSPDTSPWLKEAWTSRALPLIQQKEAEVSKTKLLHAYGSQFCIRGCFIRLCIPSIMGSATLCPRCWFVLDLMIWAETLTSSVNRPVHRTSRPSAALVVENMAKGLGWAWVGKRGVVMREAMSSGRMACREIT